MPMIQDIATTLNDKVTSKAALLEAQKRKKAADELEGYFVHQMIHEMRKTIPQDELMGGNKFASDIYYDMLDEQMSQQIVQSGGFGYSKQILKAMNKNGSASLNNVMLDQQYKGGVKPDLRWN